MILATSRCALRAILAGSCAALSGTAALGDLVNFEEIPRRELEIHLKWLGIEDKPERAIVESLYSKYIDEFDSCQAHYFVVVNWEGRLYAEEMAHNVPVHQPDSIRLGIHEAAEAARDAAAERLQDRYFADLRALFPERAESIAAMERMRYRQNILNPKQSRYFRHVPDLIMILRETAPEHVESGALVEPLDRYDRRMDDLLKAYIAHSRSGDYQAMRVAEDWDGLAKRSADRWRFIAQMRQLNQRTAATIEAALPTRARETFRERVIELSYPEVPRGMAWSEFHRLLNDRPITEAERARLEGIAAAREDAIQHALPEARERYDACFDERYIDRYEEERAAAYTERRNPTVPHPETVWQEAMGVGESFLAAHDDEIKGIRAAVDERPASSRADDDTMDSWFAGDHPMWNPSLRPEEFAAILEELGVEPDLAWVLREIHRDALRDLLGEWQRLGSRFWAARDALGRDTLEARRAGVQVQRENADHWVTFRRRVERASMDEIAALLDAETAAEFRRRAAAANRGRLLKLVEERMLGRKLFDFAAVIAEMEIEPEDREAFDAWQSEYHAEIDQALARAEEEWPARYEQMMLVGVEHGWTNEAYRDEAAKVTALGEAVAAVNDRHRRALQDVLSESDLAHVDRAILERRFPGVFIQSPAERAFALFESIDGLSPETGAALDEFKRGYNEREEAIRRRLVAAIEQWNSPGAQRKLNERMAELVAEGKDRREAYLDHPALPIFQEQSRLVQQTCRQIVQMFPGEAFDQLPGSLRIVLGWAR